MERDDIYMLTIFGFSLMWMTVTSGISKGVSAGGGFVILFGGMIFVEYYHFIKASEYQYIFAIARMLNMETKILHLFFKRAQMREYMDGIYATTLKLGIPIKVEPYGECDEIVILHQHPFEKRIIFQQGKARYKGYPVTHSKVAHVVLHLRTIVDTDHAKLIPVFWLKDAPGDVDFPQLQYLLPETEVKNVEQILEEVTNSGRS
jgi:hypothetical protein